MRLSILRQLSAALAGLIVLAFAGQALAASSIHIEWLRNGTVYGAQTISSSGSSTASSAAPDFGNAPGQARITVTQGAVVMLAGGTSPVATQTNGLRLAAGMSPVIVPVSTGDKVAVIEATDPAVSGGTAAKPISSTAYEASHVICGGPCTLFSFEVGADATLSAAAYWIMVDDATTAPADGAVAPKKCFPVSSGTPGGGATYATGGISLLVGAVVVVSTNAAGCFTQTKSAHAFISADEVGQ